MHLTPLLLALLLVVPMTAQDGLQHRLERRIQDVPARVAVSIDVITDQGEIISHYGVHEHDTMTAMSTIKLPVVVVALQLLSEGRFSMDQTVVIDSAEAARDTYSPLRDRHDGAFTTSFEEALSYAVSLSDNITTDAIIDAIGGVDAAMHRLRTHGFTCMSLGTTYRSMTRATIRRNWTTAACMNRLLLALYRGTLLDSVRSAWLYDQLLHTPSAPGRLKGDLPSGTPVAHKTGSYFQDDDTPDVQAINDVGIITMPSGDRIVISVLVNDAHMFARDVESLIADIASMAYSAHTHATR